MSGRGRKKKATVHLIAPWQDTKATFSNRLEPKVWITVAVENDTDHYVTVKQFELVVDGLVL